MTCRCWRIATRSITNLLFPSRLSCNSRALLLCRRLRLIATPQQLRDSFRPWPAAMMELHVWGSAFGLPSIDPECLAIITYLHSSSPASDWRLISSNDPSVSPSSMACPVPLSYIVLPEPCIANRFVQIHFPRFIMRAYGFLASHPSFST